MLDQLVKTGFGSGLLRRVFGREIRLSVSDHVAVRVAEGSASDSVDYREIGRQIFADQIDHPRRDVVADIFVFQHRLVVDRKYAVVALERQLLEQHTRRVSFLTVVGHSHEAHGLVHGRVVFGLLRVEFRVRDNAVVVGHLAQQVGGRELTEHEHTRALGELLRVLLHLYVLGLVAEVDADRAARERIQRLYYIHCVLVVHDKTRHVVLIPLGYAHVARIHEAHDLVVPAEGRADAVVAVELVVAVQVGVDLGGDLGEPVERPLAVSHDLIQAVRVAVEVLVQLLVVIAAGEVARAVERVVADKRVDLVLADRHFAHIVIVPPGLIEAEAVHIGDVQIQSLHDKIAAVPLRDKV